MELESEQLAQLLEPALAKVIRFLRKSSAEEAKAHGLTPSQINALRAILLSGPLRMSDLAIRLELSNSACTSMIDQLERSQLVEKMLDQADRRATLVNITPRGRTLGTSIVLSTYRRLATAMQDLKPAERYMVLGGFEALASVIER